MLTIRRAGAIALFAWTLSVTLWRTHRLPNDYAEAQWLLTWEFGFLKRGLPGAVLAWVTRALHVPVTPLVLSVVAIAVFAVFCLTMLGLTIRIAARRGWDSASLVVALVFLSSPFFVMQMDVIGYYDALVLLSAVVSVLLVMRGRPWAAAAVQVIALLIHEQSLVLAFPTVCFGTLLLQSRKHRDRVLWQHWSALLLVPAAAGALAIVWQHTTTAEAIAQYAHRLEAVGFIGENREIWAPQWLFRPFTDSFTAESPLLVTRLRDVAMLRIVLPTVLPLACLALEGFGLALFSLETMAFAMVCLAPEAMHVVAWDTPRIWTYASATAFLAMWTCAEIVPRRSGTPLATLLVGTWALMAHAFTRTPLLDVAAEAWDPAMRALLYVLPFAATLLWLSRHGTIASSAVRSTQKPCGIMTTLMQGGDTSTTANPAVARIAIVFGFVLFAILVLRTAWLGDDAYITFRSIDNLIHGYGFRWNIAERVQPFTHPLWALLLTGPFALTGEAYFTPLAVSMVLAFSAVWIFIRRIATSGQAAVVALAIFVFSKAFVEYATSGLENPLTTFLLAVFLAIWWGESARRAGWLWTIAGLLMLNRLDTGLIVLPALAVASWRRPWTETARSAAIGLAPLVAWEIFSIVYYGFAFPNTAYAKLQTGVGSGELLAQGLLYLLDSLTADPVTLLVVTAGLASVLHERNRRTLPVAAGAILYLVYIVRIGGDFMSGRFLVAPLLCSTALLCRLDWQVRERAVAPLVTVLVLLGTFATVRPPITSTKDTYITRDADGMGVGGVADERAYYYRYTGLLRWTREVPLPHDSLLTDVPVSMRGSGEVTATRNIGFFGYFAGPTVHLVDLMALSDPLLARQPAIRPWRIGHFERRLPEGYLESIRSGKNQIADLVIAAQYQQIKLVTQGPLWDRRRWRAIRRLNLGW